MEQKLIRYKESCRLCLKPRKKKLFLNLHEYYEDMFYDITGTKLNTSSQLSSKICLDCNTDITHLWTQRKVLIENQAELAELIGDSKAEITFCDPVNVNKIHTVILKEEPVDTEEILISTIDIKAEEFEEIKPEKFDSLELKEKLVGTSDNSDDCQILTITQPIKQPKLREKKKRIATSTDDLYCPICGRGFKTKSQKVCHVKAVHEKIKNIKCKFKGCNYECFQSGNMRTHEFHIHKVPFNKLSVCNSCGETFNSSSALKNHKLKVHLKTRNFECDICGYKFNRKTILRSHLSIHEKFRKKFPCDYPDCKSTLVSRHLLRQHKETVHDKICKFQCDMCGRKFQQKAIVLQHQRTFHLKIKEAECDICFKMFSNKGHLKSHKASQHPENGIKPGFECKVCKKNFQSQAATHMHAKKAHGEPQLECNQCEKKFYTNANLKDHMEHHGSLAFPCQYCSRSFRMETLLRMHLKRTHFKEKITYRCELCSSTFTRRTTYRDHVLRLHKDLEVSRRNELLENIKNMLPEEKLIIQ